MWNLKLKLLDRVFLFGPYSSHFSLLLYYSRSWHRTTLFFDKINLKTIDLQNQHNLHPHDKAYCMFICLIHIKIATREKKKGDRHTCVLQRFSKLYFYYTITKEKCNHLIPLTSLLKAICMFFCVIHIKIGTREKKNRDAYMFSAIDMSC
jgi:hypothetical protein